MGVSYLYTFKHIRPRSLSDAADGDNRDASGVVTIDRQSPPPTNTPLLTLTITWARVAAAHIARGLLSDAAANDVGTWPWPRGSENTAAAMMPGIYEATTYVCAPDRRWAVWRSINPPPTATHHPYDIRPTHERTRYCNIILYIPTYAILNPLKDNHLQISKIWIFSRAPIYLPYPFPRLPLNYRNSKTLFFFRREWKHVIISLPTYYVTIHLAYRRSYTAAQPTALPSPPRQPPNVYSTRLSRPRHRCRSSTHDFVKFVRFHSLKTFQPRFAPS